MAMGSASPLTGRHPGAGQPMMIPQSTQARFQQEMHAHALAVGRDQLMLPPLAAQACSAQISESRAEASSMMARQPRLETRDAPAAAPQMPAIIGGDIGVYIKWALVLQEQLAHVQGERASLAQQVMSLKQDNQTLREALEKGVSSAVPASAALDAAAAGSAEAAAGSAEASEVPDTSVSDRALRSSGPPAAAEAKPEPPIRSGDLAGGATRRSARAPANPFCPPPKEEASVSSPPAPEGAPPPASPAAAAVAAAAAASGKRGLPGTPPPLDPFSSPNLRYLASFLDQPGQNEQGELFGDEAKPPAKLQRVANTSKTMNRFDRLAATRA